MRIFDIHVHIYPEKIAPRALDNITRFYDGMRPSGMGLLSDCVRRMDACGVERFAAHSVAVSAHSVDSINRFIMEARAQYPDRVVPFAALHPDVEDLQGTVDGIIAQGFRGIKIHPDLQNFHVDGDRAAGMFEAIAGRLPVLIHCGDPRYDFDGPRRILHLRERFPHQPVICAHFGGWLEWKEVLELLPGHDLMIDTSSSLYMIPADEAAKAVRRFGVENVFYGSDYPMWIPEHELELFMGMKLTDREREDILWNNAARLLQL